MFFKIRFADIGNNIAKIINIQYLSENHVIRKSCIGKGKLFGRFIFPSDHFRQTAIVQMNGRRNQNICSSKLNDIVETGIVSNFINGFRFDIKENKAQHAIVCRNEIMSVGLINNTFSVFMIKTVHSNDMNAAFREMMVGVLYNISRLFQVVSLYFMADVQNIDVRIQRDYTRWSVFPKSEVRVITGMGIVLKKRQI